MPPKIDRVIKLTSAGRFYAAKETEAQVTKVRIIGMDGYRAAIIQGYDDEGKLIPAAFHIPENEIADVIEALQSILYTYKPPDDATV